MMQQASGRAVLLTGATGFIGGAIFKRLLLSGERILVLARPTAAATASRRLDALGVPSGDSGQASMIEGDLARPRFGLEARAWEALADQVGTIINVAGSTRFDAGPDGEPWRTNVEGVRRVAELAGRAGAALHHFSTAFVCGDVQGAWDEVNAAPGTHRNAYEQSKWAGEEILRAELAAGRLRGLTIYRPTIVVADDSGQSDRCNHGLMAFIQSIRRVARLKAGLFERVRMDAEPEGLVHLAPLGWVADAFMHILSRPECHGGVYHLALERPPTIADLLAAIERYAGLSFEGYVNARWRDGDENNPVAEDSQGRDEERLFYRLCSGIRPYFRQTMTVSTDRLRRALQGSGLEARGFEAGDWPHALGIDHEPGDENGDEELRELCQYFEGWLALHAPHSSVSRIRFTTAAGFQVRSGPGWTCRWHDGQLVSVERGVAASEVRFRYEVERGALLEIIAGRRPAQEAFFQHQAEIHGDVEAGLKFIMILQQFVHEFPWRGVPATSLIA